MSHTEESAGSFRNTDFRDFMDRALTRIAENPSGAINSKNSMHPPNGQELKVVVKKE